MKYDVFISYRREGGYDTAKHLNDLLVRDGYTVSFDIDTLRSGNFDTQLLERIEQCKDFILIVDKHAFDRTLNPAFDPKKDWLRCELAHAIKHNKNIIPVFLSDISGFPDGLPADIISVTKRHGPQYNREYFNDFYRTLKDRFLKSRQSKHIKTISIIIFSAIIFSTIYFIFNNESFSNQANQLTVLLPTLNNSLDDWDENIDANEIKRYCSIGFYNIPIVSLNNAAIAGPDNALLYPEIVNQTNNSIRDFSVIIDIFYDNTMKACFNDSLFYVNTDYYNIISQTENRLSLSYKNNILHSHSALPLPISTFVLFIDDRFGTKGGKVTFNYFITYDGAKEPIVFEYIAKIYYQESKFTNDFIGRANYDFLDEIVYNNYYNPRKQLYEDGEYIIIYCNNIYRDVKHLSNEEFKELKINGFSSLQN